MKVSGEPISHGDQPPTRVSPLGGVVATETGKNPIELGIVGVADEQLVELSESRLRLTHTLVGYDTAEISIPLPGR